MRCIDKQPPPESLSQFQRTSEGLGWDSLSTVVKNEIRESLLQEQGCICCYCMSRIEAESSQIEHWLAQSCHEQQRFDYGNMLAVCEGNKGTSPSSQHCDRKKGDRDLKYNPANPEHRIEDRVRYLRDGSITSDDPDFDNQINEVLNLNFRRLRDNRKNAYDGLIISLGRSKRVLTRRQIQNLIEQWTTPINGKLRPYCCVVIYFLRKRLRRA